MASKEKHADGVNVPSTIRLGPPAKEQNKTAQAGCAAPTAVDDRVFDVFDRMRTRMRCQYERERMYPTDCEKKKTQPNSKQSKSPWTGARYIIATLTLASPLTRNKTNNTQEKTMRRYVFGEMNTIVPNLNLDWCSASRPLRWSSSSNNMPAEYGSTGRMKSPSSLPKSMSQYGHRVMGIE